MRTISIGLIAFCMATGAALAQQGNAGDDVSKGHYLALMVCAICHVAAPDQEHRPVLNPPGPSFASIAQRKDISAESLANFLKTTHRGLDHPTGMPNPDLADFQVKQAVAYILSLRK